jgi:hypothetical protein
VSRQALAEWLDKRAQKQPVEIDICHHRGDKVDSVTLEENESGAELVERIYALAEEDAKNMFGPQGYWVVLRVFGTRDVLARKSITVDGEQHEKGRGSESPDEWGLTSQSMRHTEAFAKTMVNGLERFANMISRENDRMHAMSVERDRLEIERFALQRQLAHDVAQQRVEEQKVIAESRRDAWMQRQLELLLPVGAAKIFGPKVDWSREGEILLALVSILTEEQKSRIIGMLDPASRALLMSIANGELNGGFLSLGVQRLMSNMSKESYQGILSVLDNDYQRAIFGDLYMVKTHGIEHAEKGGDAPRYEPAQLPEKMQNGTNQAPEAPKGNV